MASVQKDIQLRADGYRFTTEDNDGRTDRADPFPQNSH